jgi:hypothetical protein
MRPLFQSYFHSEAGIASDSPPSLASQSLYRLPIYLTFTVMAVLTNFLIGKELGWDVLNYHLYAGFSAVNDRFAQDYFAAGPQSYFNPFAYVPFYLLISANFPALLIASILALVHSAILWLTFELGVALGPAENPRMRVAIGLCAGAFAFMNPLLIQQFGSSYADVTTGELVLAGWVLLAHAIRAPSIGRVIGAGILFGAASALKLTNSVHVIAGLSMLIMLPLGIGGRIRQAFLCGSSTALGFVIFAAPWSYRLQSMFGNPLFPLINSVFRSPEFTTEPLRHFRFTPDSISEAIWKPFAIVDPAYMVHSELRAPDLRYALLFVLVGVIVARAIWQRFGKGSSHSSRTLFNGSTRLLGALGIGFAVDWILWLSGSGNGRYFLPGACLAGVLAVALIFRLFADNRKARNYALVTLFSIQAVQLWMGTDYRWHSTPWGGPWFDVEVPATLRSRPNLFLSVGGQTNSFIAPYLSADSGLINVSGGYVLGSQGANGIRIESLLERYRPNLRVLLRGAKLHEDAEALAPRRSQVNESLAIFGLHVDMSDCATITVNGLPPELEITVASQNPIVPADNDKSFLVSCHVAPGAIDLDARVAAQRLADVVLNRVEDACPKLFQPRRPLTEYNGKQFLRRYMNTDLAAWVSNGQVKFVQIERASHATNLGAESAWVQAPQPLICGRRDGIYFASPFQPH